jgi:glycosyltransferase involved in cell wall biosynthesis
MKVQGEHREGIERFDASVIVCTRDRCERLGRTLDDLAAQRVGTDQRFEIVVVDNASTDATESVVRRFVARSPVPARYLLEPRPGLSRARNLGWRAARGRILVFTDDDMVFPPRWLERILILFTLKPEPAAVTGPVAVHPDSHPSLISSFGKHITRYRFPMTPWEVGRGNNMAFSREWLERVGAFDVRLGAGTPAGSGEDTDMLYRILKAGGEILFDPGLEVYHDHGRHDPAAIRRIVRNYAVGGTAFLVKHAVRFDLFSWKLLYWRYLGFKQALRRDFGEDSYDPPLREVRRIYWRGYWTGLARGFRDLLRRPW